MKGQKVTLIISLILVFVSVFALASNPNSITADIINYTTSYSAVEKETEVLIYNDRAYVPLREISENIGRDVEWVGDSSMIVINDKDSGRDMGNANESYLGKVYQYYAWIFYTEDGSLYKVKTDGSQNIKIFEQGHTHFEIRDIHVIDGWVYFILYNYEESVIYKSDLNGNIVSTLVKMVQVEDNRQIRQLVMRKDFYIYLYHDSAYGRDFVYYVNLQTNEQKELLNVYTSDCWRGFSNEFLYYQDYRLSENGGNVSQLKRLNITSGETEVIFDNFVPNRQTIFRGEKIYYIGYSTTIGGRERPIIEYDISKKTEREIIFLENNTFNIDPNGEWLYFISNQGEYAGKLCKTSLDHNETFEVLGNVAIPYVTETHVVAVKNGEIWLIDKDGNTTKVPPASQNN